jgi:hypothetical protein
MTPDEYIPRVRAMVVAGQHADALAFAEQHQSTIEPPLTPYQTLLVAETLHVSAMTVAMDEYAARRSSDETAEVA